MPSCSPCRVQGCSEFTQRSYQFLCTGHWNTTPEDLKDRLKFAALESRQEIAAALHAISEYHNAT